MQSYTEILDTTTITDSRSLLLNNDKTAMSCSSGTQFPTEDLQIGMLCYRTDSSKLYQLKTTDPTATWVILMDLSLGWVEAVPKAGGAFTGPLALAADPAQPLEAATKQYVDAAIPAGITGMFARNTPPAGWLKANGAAVSRTTYAVLFAAIGTTFGPGDGTTTFNLPDLRGQFPRGWDDSRGVDPSRVFGSTQASQNLSHVHGVTDPTHAHAVYDPAHVHGASADAQGNHQHTFTGLGGFGGSAAGGVGFAIPGVAAAVTDANGTHAHNIGIGAAGTGIWLYGAATGISIVASGGTESRPTNVALLACIKF
jgi:microcystin-dependent protein